MKKQKKLILDKITVKDIKISTKIKTGLPGSSMISRRTGNTEQTGD